MTASLATVVNDPVRFAETVLKANLFDYQKSVARSDARLRVLCAGRQSGKSEILAILAIHTAVTKRNATVYLVSGGEKMAEKLLAKITKMVRKAGLEAGIVGDLKNILSFTNGSTIEAVPTSEARIRGETVDLLILDESGIISDGIWDAAWGTTIAAQPAGRTIAAGTPWGGRDHWYRSNFERGLKHPDDAVESFTWTSYDSPLADRAALEDRKRALPSDKFRREYLAEWADETGAFLTTEELNNATVDYTYTTDTTPWPYTTQPRGGHVYAGIDWGMSDLNVLACVGTLDDHGGLNTHRENDPVYFVAHLEGHQNLPYQDFVDRIWKVGTHYNLRHVMSETNGVGGPATQMLHATKKKRLDTLQGRPQIHQVHTSAQSKTTNFGQLKVLLQRRQLILPNHGELLKQLNNLQYTELQHGNLKIEVPANIGHDDHADALSLAIGAITRRNRRIHRDTHSNAIRRYWHGQQLHQLDDGTQIPHQPMLLD